MDAHRKIALIIEYDGTRYHGFQLQPQSPTVQEVLEGSIYQLTGETTRVNCAGRTDAGVHAQAQVVSFWTGSRHGVETILRALNHYLPADVAVQSAYVIPNDYNVRSRALSRSYRYMVLNRSSPSPLLRERAYWVKHPLAIEGMNRAAALLVGERDFGPFSGPVPLSRQTVRQVMRAEFRREGELVRFDVEGASFLPQQVRRMAGALLRVGVGSLTYEGFRSLIESQKRGLAGPTLPPQGLYLMRVRYEEFPPLGADRAIAERPQLALAI